MKTGIYIAALFALLLGTGCHSAEKLFDEGRYDELLTLAERKMKGQKVRKEKYVLMAEEAFQKVTERDMARVERLRQSGRTDDWREILSIANRIEARQNRLSPYLPLVAENGYQATFSFVRTQDIVQHAEAEIADLLYDEGKTQLSRGRNGDQHAAQIAYDRFDEIIRRKGDYRDAYLLRDEAHDLGTMHILLAVENRAQAMMPQYVAEILDGSAAALNNTFWSKYYTKVPDEGRIDRLAKLVISSIEVGPELLREEKVKRERKVEDGWDYVLDDRGNVLKDSLGNDVKVTRYTRVKAVVVKTNQDKGAMLRGQLQVSDARTGELLETRPFQVENHFYHQAQTFFGDERALEDKDRVHIGLLPFPDDAAMMMTLAEMTRPAFVKELEKCRYL